MMNERFPTPAEITDLISGANAALPGTFGPGKPLEGKHVTLIARVAGLYADALERHRAGDERALENLERQLDRYDQGLSIVGTDQNFTGLGIVFARTRQVLDGWLRDVAEEEFDQAL